MGATTPTAESLDSGATRWPAGFQTMLWYFGILALVAMVFAILLRNREVGPQGHGLEWPESRTVG